MTKKSKRNGATWDGWKEYRYGSARPITLPRIFKGQAAQAMVNRVMDTMRDWRFSPWEHEGSARAGLRSSFCESGYGWQVADNEAMALIGQSLRNMGAKRPSELEGQRAYTIPFENCQRCGGLLDDEDKLHCRRFCSNDCRDWSKLDNFLMYRIVTGLARGAAWYAGQKEKLPERPCENCGKAFRPGTLEYYRKTDTCSPECARALVAARQEPKQCLQCDSWFKPVVGHGKFCTVGCRDQHRSDEKAAASAEGRQPRPCEECGLTYTPTRSDQKFCSVRCNWTAQAEKDRLRRREKIEGKTCLQCDEPFDAIKSSAKYCSRKCANRYAYLRQAEAKEASRFACEETFLEAAE